jgi:Na+-driven multidrug efflux pump
VLVETIMTHAVSSSTVNEPQTTSHSGFSVREVWTTFLDALRGAPLDLTTAPIGKALVMLAVPMIMEMIMESIFALVDVFWVSSLGPNAVAAVGLTESMMMILYSLAMGVSIGVMALVARRIGEKDPDAAARTAAQGIVLGLAIALCIGVVGIGFAPELLLPCFSCF